MDAVLNWLCQSAVITIATAIVLRITPTVHARTRYGVLWMAIVVIVVVPLVPPMWLPDAALDSNDSSTMLGPAMSIPVRWWTSDAIVVSCWGLWSTFAAARLARSIHALRRARHQSRDVPTTQETRLHHWSTVRATGRPARLVLSDDVRYAAVMGFASPLIAIAPALVDQLTDDELDRVVIHEWAHVQRRDDLAHLAQLLIDVIVGWHPAIWWLGRRLRLEREVACDVAAVAVTHSVKRYAACLVKLASLPPALSTLPALGALIGKELECRVRRVLSVDPDVRPHGRTLLVVGGLLFVVFGLGVGHVRLIDAVEPSVRVELHSTPPSIDAASDVPVTAQPAVVASLSEHTETRKQRQSTHTRPAFRRVQKHVQTETTFAFRPSVTLAQDSATQGTTEHFAAEDVSAPQHAFPTGGESQTRAPDVALAEHNPPNVPAPEPVKSPWKEAADAGVAVGRASQEAGTATAGFFTRFATRVARSF